MPSHRRVRKVTRVREGGDAFVLRGVHGRADVDLVEVEALALLEVQGLADAVVDLKGEPDGRARM